MQVAGKVRDRQTIAFHPYETGLTTAMGNIHRALAIGIDITGDEESIGASNQRSGCLVERIQMFSRARLRIRQRHSLKLPQLDVLRAVAEGLIHAYVETLRGQIADMAIEAIAPAGVQFDAEQTDWLAIAQLRRIIGSDLAGEVQMFGIGRMGKPRGAFEQTGPRPPVRIDGAVQQERQLLIELTVLIRHPGANHLAPEGFHAFGNADMGL